MIYFIQGEITKKIKIGCTGSEIFETRFQPIKSSSPDHLIFLGGMPGNMCKEKEIQDKFKNKNQELLSFI